MVGRLILAAILAAGLASAQKGGGKGGSKGMDDMSSMPRMQTQSRFEQIAEKLKLSKEQKEQAQNILNGAQESAGPLSQQINQGRQMIVGAMVNGKDSGDDYNKLVGQYTAVLAQMDSLDATVYGKIYTLLKPNQQKNADQVFADLISGYYMRAGGGGGGRRKGQ
jgi:hypothetical protein